MKRALETKTVYIYRACCSADEKSIIVINKIDVRAIALYNFIRRLRKIIICKIITESDIFTIVLALRDVWHGCKTHTGP